MLILNTYPFVIALLPFYAAMIIICGVLAGCFFRVNSALLGSASRLFFIENNGFVLGWIIGFAGFVVYGSVFNLIAPLILGVFCIGLAWWTAHRPSQ